MADRLGERSAGEEIGRGWGLALALILLLGVLWIVAIRRQPPAPKPADAPAAEFSAERALALVRELDGEGVPHPTGSPANAEVRNRLVARLRAMGYAPEIQEDFVCGRPALECARVRNVVARLEGTAPTGAVLFMAHYDSAGAGPGISDDLAGVAAVLESARALKAGPAPRNTVIFLLDEGEEVGLLGAEAFARSPAGREAKVVVNLEARGTEGPSLLFETSGDDGWMVPLFAAEASHPLTSSVFVTIYQLMPNDTDLSVFKRKQVNGLNFAYVGGPTHYHTPLDNLQNLSLASLQHQGDNGLGAVRGLGQADLAHAPRGSAVFFDVLGWGVVHWPRPWTPPFALLVLALLLAAVWRGRAIGALTVGQVAFGLLALLALIVTTAVLSAGLTLGLQSVLRAPWIARPLPLVASFWLLPLVLAGLLLPRLGRRAGRFGLWAGVWLGWALLGLALAMVAPGPSYLFLIPAALAGVAVLALGRRGAPLPEGAAVFLPLLVAGLLWMPILLPLYDGLGIGSLAPIATLVAILATGLAPLYLSARPPVRRGVTGAALVGMLLGITAAALAPQYSTSSPQPLMLQYQEDASAGQAFWLVRAAPPLPPSLRKEASFEAQMEQAFPLAAQERTWRAQAPRAGLPAPELRVLEEGVTPDGRRRLRLHLASLRGARAARVLIPAAAKLQSLAIDGHPVDTGGSTLEPGQGYYAFGIRTLEPAGHDLELILGERASQDWYVLDLSPGLPPAGQALQRARPDTATSFQDGDATIVSRKLRV
jgi:peptidase M28-like protein